MKHYAAFFLSLYSVCFYHKVTLGEEIVQWGNFKYPYSQLLVLYRLLKSNTQLFSFFDVSHTRNIRNHHLLQSASVINVKKTTMPNLQERDF